MANVQDRHHARCIVLVRRGARREGHQRGSGGHIPRASVDTGRPLPERRLAAMFGKTSRRWARNRMAEARRVPASVTAEP
jgi:hypothetical protein